MTDTPPLPPGWVWTTLGEIALIKYGKNLPIKKFTNSGYKVFGANGIIGYYSEYLYEEQQVLISCRGAYSGSINLSPPKSFVTNNSLILELFFSSIAMKLYLYYILQSIDRSVLVTGTAQPQVTINNAQPLPIPLPPLAEQRRIVDAIETQFTRLDAGIAALKQAQAKLKRYRAAVLKAACEGSLVPQNPADEPASELLARILKERRAKWNGRGKYKEPAAPDTATLPELPVGWVWATVEQIVKVATGATPKRGEKKYYENGYIPWITSAAVNNLFVNEGREFITDVAIQETNVKIFPKGTLLVAMYGEGKTRGKVSELKIEAATNQALAALMFETVSSSHCRPFIKTFLQMNYDNIRHLSSGGVQPNLNLSIIKRTYIPLPPLAEQRRIVAEVERRLSVVSEVEAAVESNLKRAERLRQAILKRAFEGKLVPQNPNDEPASALLARIRAAREKETPKKKTRRKK